MPIGASEVGHATLWTWGAASATDLHGTAPGFSGASDISHTGLIVGAYFDGSIWQGAISNGTAGGWTLIPPLPGDYWSRCHAVNASGTAFCTSETTTGVTTEFLWTGGSPQVVQTTDVALYDIDDGGNLVGASSPQDVSSPVRRAADGTIVTLPLPAPATYRGAARAVSPNGAYIAGWAEEPGAGEHVVLWHNGTATNLGKPLGGSCFATDVNNLGHVVGFCFNGNGEEGFVVANGVTYNLGTTAGVAAYDGPGKGLAINDNRQVAGLQFYWQGAIWTYPEPASLPTGPSTALGSTIGSNAVLAYHSVPGLNRPYGVNDDGLIVGDYGGNNIAAIWSPATGFMSLGLVEDGSTNCCSSLFAVNRHGQAAGFSHSAANTFVMATMWSQSTGSYVNLGVTGRPYAQAINDVGDVVGVDYTGFATSWYKPHNGPFVWLPRGPYTLTIEARGINDAGRIAGDVYVGDNDTRAIAWPSYHQAPVELPSLGGTRSAAAGVNAAGDIVGWSEITPGSSVRHAALWPASGGVVDLSSWPGGCAGTSEARAITAQGVIAGRCNGLPVIWTALEGQRSLPLPSGVTDVEPTAIANGHAVGLIGGFGAIRWTIIAGPNATPVGSNVNVQPTDGTTGQPSAVQMTFGTVTGGGTTTVTSATIGSGGGSPPPPPQFRLGNPPTYYNIETTASFTGVVTVCIDYSSVNYGNEGQLKLLHYNATTQSWENITTSLDIQTNVICGATSSLSPFIVAETNLAPSVTGITLPSAPVALGQAAALTATFADPNLFDTHTASIDWGAANTGGTVTTEPSSNGPGSIIGSYTYGASGVYTVNVTVSDGLLSASRSSSLDVPAYVVVYDPSAGFVTGGGWLHSPAHACQVVALCGSTAEGKATFGFVSRYQRGATVPTGNTHFQYHAGSFVFASTSYDWLVVSGPKAQYKGSGTINGAGDYAFLLTATDGQMNGGGGVDRFRIKVWDKNTGAVIYDNVAGSPDDLSGTPQALGGGSIQISAK